MLKKKLGIIIILIVTFFLAIDFAWYIQSLKKLYLQNEQKESIIFLTLKLETTRLLDKLMDSFEKEKSVLLRKHKLVYEYIKNKPDFINYSLDEIYSIINKGLDDKPYDIYITDENFVVKNSTFAKDIGLDLSFAKELFVSNHKKNILGISTPIYETSEKTFFSYTSSFLTYKDGKGSILQISYRYKNLDLYLEKIKNIFIKFPSIKDHKCYTKSLENQAYEIILKDYKPYRINIEEIYLGIKHGEFISKILGDKELFIEHISQNGKNYSALYSSQQTNLYGNSTKILHYLLLDQSPFEEQVKNLNIAISVITIIGILSIIFFTYFIHRILVSPILELQKSIQDKKLCTEKSLLSRVDEIGSLIEYYNHNFIQIKDIINAKDRLLEDKNKFVNNAIHEINTPLSVISINNSLRDITQGKNEYSSYIESAIKTLKNTMDDLNFSMYGNQKEVIDKAINLSDFLQKRVKYFQSIAESSEIYLRLRRIDKCYVVMGQIELTRFIDNNLSNAIKYSNSHTNVDIRLVLEDKRVCLSFTNQGKTIKNIDEIFKRFYREDRVKGGFGLGLDIIKQICDKYEIKIITKSKNNITTFAYYIKCHTKVMS